MIAFILKIYKLFMPFYKKLVRDNIFAIAGQTAFFLILSVVPMLIFLLSMIQTMRLMPGVISYLTGFSQDSGNLDSLQKSISGMYDQSFGVSVVTIIVTLWSASKGIHAITNGLNRIHNTHESRNWLVVRLYSMLHTFVFLLIIILTILILFLGSTINNLIKPYLGNLPGYLVVIYSLRHVFLFIYQVLLFAVMYRNIPNLSKEERREFGIRCQLPGALFCAASWHVLIIGISVYVNNFNGFSIYRGLAQLAMVMILTYFCMVCLMIGAEINFYFHKEIDWFTRRFSIRYIKEKRAERKAAKK